jgi:hypothetical protein
MLFARLPKRVPSGRPARLSSAAPFKLAARTRASKLLAQTVAGPAGNWESEVLWMPHKKLFVAVASSPAGTVGYSQNGLAWTTSDLGDQVWNGSCYSPDLRRCVIVADGGANPRSAYSDDGVNWTTVAMPGSCLWRAVTWSREFRRFVAVAYSGTNRIAYSSDGTSWTAVAADSAVVWGLLLAGAAAFRSGWYKRHSVQQRRRTHVDLKSHNRRLESH